MDPILIVDDEKDNLQAIQRLLRNNFEVTVCQSPFDAVKLLQNKKFNVIISDQRMPEMTGVELLEKANHVSPQTTRILLTGYTDIDSVIDAINRGHIYRYIAKPWDPEDFKITVRQANEAFRLREEIEDKNRKLQSALEELQVLDQAKARFLSLVSHELNTPLTTLSSFSQLLIDLRKQLPAEIQRSVENIGSASQRLSEIVDSILTYLKVSAHPELTIEKIQWDQLVKNSMKRMQPLSKKRGIRIEPDVKGDSQGDPDKLQIALDSILQELMLRAEEKSQIQIHYDKGENSLTFQWKGTPIPEEAFSALETGGPILNHHRNLGLFLATARLAVENHRGKLYAENSGSRLVMRLPK